MVSRLKDNSVWLAIIGAVVAGIWWAAILEADVADLKDDAVRLRSVVELLAANQKQTDRLEAEVGKIYAELYKRSDYKQIIAEIQEHLRSNDAMTVRNEARLDRLEHAVWRERWWEKGEPR